MSSDSICADMHCPMFEDCSRALATPSPMMQSFFFGDRHGEECGDFVPIEKKNENPRTGHLDGAYT